MVVTGRTSQEHYMFNYPTAQTEADWHLTVAPAFVCEARLSVFYAQVYTSFETVIPQHPVTEGNILHFHFRDIFLQLEKAHLKTEILTRHFDMHFL